MNTATEVANYAEAAEKLREDQTTVSFAETDEEGAEWAIFIRRAHDPFCSDLEFLLGDAFTFKSNLRKYAPHLTEEDMERDDIIPLSYFEHGACRWAVRGDGLERTPDFQWDGTRSGGALLPNRDVWGDRPREKVLEAARDFCEDLTAVFNGWVEYFAYEVYPLRSLEDGTPLLQPTDYRFDTPVDEGGYGGCIATEKDTKYNVMTIVKEARP